MTRGTGSNFVWLLGMRTWVRMSLSFKTANMTTQVLSLRSVTKVRRAAPRGGDWRQAGILETSSGLRGKEPDGNRAAQT